MDQKRNDYLKYPPVMSRNKRAKNMHNKVIKYDISSIMKKISGILYNTDPCSQKITGEMRTALVLIFALAFTTSLAGKKYLIETGQNIFQ